MVTTQVIHLNHSLTSDEASPQAIMAGDYLYLSGILPAELKTGSITDDTISNQIMKICKNIRAILGTQTLGLENMVQMTIYLASDLNYRSKKDLAEINVLLKNIFGSRLPAKTFVFVDRLPDDAKVCFDGVAYVERD